MSADLDTQIRAEVERRMAIAQAASTGPWMAATHTGRKDGVSLIGRVEDRGTGGQAIAVFAASDVYQRAKDAAHAALHDPVDAIRRYGYALKVLDRHQGYQIPAGNKWAGSYNCERCNGIVWPCSEVADLATSLGIEVSS